MLIVGSGLAGLSAAAVARERGADVTVREAASRVGGATWDSAGWVWRYLDVELFRAECSDGDPRIQQLVIDELDASVEWLRELGVPVLTESTGREFTTGARIDCRRAIEVLAERVGRERIELDRRVRDVVPDGRSLLVDGERFDAVVLAGGGYALDVERIARERGLDPAAARRDWVVRPQIAGDGSSMDAAIALGSSRPVADGRCLLRVVPAAPAPLTRELLIAGSELLVDGSHLFDADGVQVARAATDWSGARQLDAWMQRGGTGMLALSGVALDARVHSGSVREIVEALAAAGVEIERVADGIKLPVRVGITSTWCGLAVEPDGCVRLPGAHALPLFAAGCDAAATALGGTASGLAQALVLGRVCGQSAALVPAAAT